MAWMRSHRIRSCPTTSWGLSRFSRSENETVPFLKRAAKFVLLRFQPPAFSHEPSASGNQPSGPWEVRGGSCVRRWSPENCLAATKRPPAANAGKCSPASPGRAVNKPKTSSTSWPPAYHYHRKHAKHVPAWERKASRLCLVQRPFSSQLRLLRQLMPPCCA